MNTTTKWIFAVIAAAVIGGGSVALLGNRSSTPTPATQPPVVQQPTAAPQPSESSQPSPTKTTEKTEDCLIKGNISSSGEKIYHVPGQRYYNQTVINVSAGEKMFCTEQEAIDAGWRKSKV